VLWGFLFRRRETANPKPTFIICDPWCSVTLLGFWWDIILIGFLWTASFLEVREIGGRLANVREIERKCQFLHASAQFGLASLKERKSKLSWRLGVFEDLGICSSYLLINSVKWSLNRSHRLLCCGGGY
jgi:hypothetical protein